MIPLLNTVYICNLEGEYMYLKENAIEFEKSIFNNRSVAEQTRFINNYFKENNISITVDVLQYDATGKLKTFTVDEYNKIKNVLDENYTYVLKKSIKENNNDAIDIELSLYVSIYKDKPECKLVVYKSNRKIYYNLDNFPKKYIKIIDSMFDAINVFRV